MPKHYDQHEIDRLREHAHRGPEALAELTRRERETYTRPVTAMNALRLLAVAGYRIAWTKNLETGVVQMLLWIGEADGDAVTKLVLKDVWLDGEEIARIDRLLAGQHPETGASLGFTPRSVEGCWTIPYWDLPITRIS
jgi:hypothetical protein